MSGELVLVTGGSGYVASRCLLHLTQAGYRVRTTVRSAQRESQVRAMLPPDARIEFAVADLTSDDGWTEAATGCDYVMHVASPFPAADPRDDNEVIRPAVDGTLRALRAARAAGVKRTVLTSSFAAIGYGYRDTGRVFTEDDWSDPDGEPMVAYVRSKLLAERAAWDFADREGLELSVVNPVGVFGPPLGRDYSVYIELVEQMLTGRLPALPRISYGVVDVRDVADLHLRAMTDPAAAGERFLAIAGVMALPEIAALLRSRLGADARRVPTGVLPDWAVRLGARFSAKVASAVPDLGVVRDASSEKARRVLGWSPRSAEESVLDTATSLIELGVVPGQRRKALR